MCPLEFQVILRDATWIITYFLCLLPIERYQVVGRVVHMDFVREHLKTKKNVNFKDTQKRTNNIELAVLADTVYLKVETFLSLSNLLMLTSKVYKKRIKKNILRSHMRTGAVDSTAIYDLDTSPRV